MEKAIEDGLPPELLIPLTLASLEDVLSQHGIEVHHQTINEMEVEHDTVH